MHRLIMKTCNTNYNNKKQVDERIGTHRLNYIIKSNA